MPKASEAASRLRTIADALDKIGETDIPTPSLYFGTFFTMSKQKRREAFLAIASVFPRPYRKNPDWANGKDLVIEHDSNALQVWAKIERDMVCKLVKPAQPAEYDCEPLLTAEEEQAIR